MLQKHIFPGTFSSCSRTWTGRIHPWDGERPGKSCWMYMKETMTNHSQILGCSKTGKGMAGVRAESNLESFCCCNGPSEVLYTKECALAPPGISCSSYYESCSTLLESSIQSYPYVYQFTANNCRKTCFISWNLYCCEVRRRWKPVIKAEEKYSSGKPCMLNGKIRLWGCNTLMEHIPIREERVKVI